MKKFNSLPDCQSYPTIAKTLLASENKMPLKPLTKSLISLGTYSNIDTAHMVLSIQRLISRGGRNDLSYNGGEDNLSTMSK